MQNGTMDNVPGTLKSIVRCYGIQLGGSREWQFAWEKYLLERSSAEKTELLISLGCTRNRQLIQRLLRYANNATVINKWHVSQIFKSLSNSIPGRQASWNYLKRHWNQIIVDLKEIAGDFAKIFRSFNTEKELAEVEKFMENNELGAAGPEFHVEKEKLELNLFWSQRNTGNLIQWLKDRIVKDTQVTAPTAK